MALRLVLVLVALVALATEARHAIRVHNNCPYPVWLGTQSNGGKPAPERGGFKLADNQRRTFYVPNGWSGRFWGRTKCDGSGNCETGDCGRKIECNGAGGVPPATLAAMTLDGSNGYDFYDISVVDGFNLAVSLSPIRGTTEKRGSGSDYQSDCSRAGCYRDLNENCPNELVKLDGAENPIACLSACQKYNTDEFCCRGDYANPEKCDPTKWRRNFAADFKDACPDAFSYPFDGKSSSFVCKSTKNRRSGYELKFCP